MIKKLVEQYAWTAVDDRVFNHVGCVVDLGCFDWFFTEPLFGLKRVIGADPFELPRVGVELYQGCVGPPTGTVLITHEETSSSTIMTEGKSVISVSSLSWRDFCTQYSIDSVSLLKINIEAGEYDLLDGMDESDFSKIDQIAVSFHDWCCAKVKDRTAHTKATLEKYYTLHSTFPEFGWVLAIKNEDLEKH